MSLAADDVGDASSRGVPIGVPKLRRYAALAQLAAGWRDVPSAGLMQNSADVGGGMTGASQCYFFRTDITVRGLLCSFSIPGSLTWMAKTPYLKFSVTPSCACYAPTF